MSTISRVRPRASAGPQIVAQHLGISHSVSFDAAEVETSRFSNIVSQHPLESGTSVTDHVEQRPVELSIDGLLSNTPLPRAIGSMRSRGDLLGLNRNRISTVFEWLVDIWERGTKVNVLTGLRLYKDMVITDISPNRQGGARSDSRNALRLTIRLQEIKEVSATLVQIDPDIFAESVRSSATDENDQGSSGDIDDTRPTTTMYDIKVAGHAAIIELLGGDGEDFIERINADTVDPESAEEFQRFMERRRREGIDLSEQ